MTFGLEQYTIDTFISIFEQNSKVDKAIIFGSRAKGNYRPDSDIDIAIKGQELTTADIIEISVAFEQKGIRQKFDLINYNSIKEPALTEHIDRIGIEFYSRWSKYKFSDFALVNPPVKLKKGEVHSFVEMKDLSDGQKFCEPHQERETSGGARFQNGDTLFARITPCLENGKICQVRNLKSNIGFGSTEFHVFRGKENISDTDFIFYLSRWDEVRNFAEMNFDGTSGRQRVPKEAFDNLFLNLPPLSEQKAIAEVLNSLDDKIDLLHQNNLSLESLAEAIFRKWFVEEANANWEVGTIEDEFNFTMGQSPLGNTLNEEGKGMIFFQGSSDFGFRFPEVRIYTTEPSRFAKQHDTLISVRAPVGAMNIAIEDCCLGRGVAAFRYKHNKNFYSYTYYKLRSLMKPIKQFEDNGSVFGSIGKDDFKKLELILPPKELIEKFQKEIGTLDEKIFENSNQIKTLQQTRDNLIPKLMSGEARVN